MHKTVILPDGVVMSVPEPSMSSQTENYFFFDALYQHSSHIEFRHCRCIRSCHMARMSIWYEQSRSPSQRYWHCHSLSPRQQKAIVPELLPILHAPDKSFALDYQYLSQGTVINAPWTRMNPDHGLIRLL